ncbi:GntR family transcriptional regulator [Actinomadura vinacea]|uniref:GntR family transcriptional regulator n=1 Tax=Actinomadura vinacea TaxID=115336 RepID=A0ABP5XM80_9ACTN
MSPTKLGFREIAKEIRREILDGRYPPGSVLPAVPVLAERYAASPSLVNRAIQVLAAEGKVRPQQGRGTKVTWLPPRVHSPARFNRSTREEGGAKGAFDAEIKALGLEPKHEITVEHAEPPAEVADLMNLPHGEVNCLVRRRRLLASGIPIVLNASWFPLSIAQGTILEEAGPVIVGGVKSALAELGHRQTRATERITDRLPDEAEALALEISPERTVFEIVHVGHTADDAVVEVTITVTPAHYLIIESNFRLD